MSSSLLYYVMRLSTVLMVPTALVVLLTAIKTVSETDNRKLSKIIVIFIYGEKKSIRLSLSISLIKKILQSDNLNPSKKASQHDKKTIFIFLISALMSLPTVCYL